VWKKAFSISGIDYDINQDLVATPSKPMLDRDEAGRIRRVVSGNDKSAGQIVRGMKAQYPGKAIRTTRFRESRADSEYTWNFQIGANLRRLVVKMCAAFLAYFRPRRLLSQRRLPRISANGNIPDVPVRTAFLKYPALDRIRRGLAHSIFVEANGNTRRCYGVVQFFGVMQFYAVLNSSYSGTCSFAAFGDLNPVAQNEEFQEIASLGLTEAPSAISPQEYETGIHDWQTALTQLLNGRDGTEMAITIEPRLPALLNNLSISEGSTAISNRTTWSSDTQDLLTSE
jgi:hypothetical protein